ncbi:MAG: proprotein convertase P-domain-containing protein [Caldilineales bacterium]
MQNLSKRALGASLLLFVAILAVAPVAWRQSLGDTAAGRGPQGAAQQGPNIQGGEVGTITVGEAVTPVLTKPARDLPAASTEYYLDREINPRLNTKPGQDPNLRIASGPDPLLAAQQNAPEAAPNAFNAPLVNIAGQGYTGVNPPDTVGEIGPNHYVQMINGSGGALVRIYTKAGATVGNQFALDSLGSGACASGYGDPVVLYDTLAGRWLLSEFAQSGNHLCVYVSTSGDPTGAYYAYDFTTPTFPDYPKYSVWPDGYYVTTNESSPTVYALDRAKMLNGQAATFQRFTGTGLSGFGFESFTPADLDGSTAPPAGSPAIIMRHRDTEAHGPTGYSTQDILELWQFSVNWTTPASSSFTKVADILTSEFSSDLCGLTSFACIPQPGTTTKLDPLREVIMNRLAYRNFGTHQTLVGNLVTDVNGADLAGVRWFELRKSGGSWTLYQEGTYSPDAVNRWMGAIAMDGSGNIALGYNVSSSSVSPGLRYTGRLAGDPLGTMTQAETTLVSGTSRNASNRYGDYASMSIDPVDDCTFWFTGEYNTATSWSTRIGSFKFDQCGGGPTPTPTTPAATATPTTPAATPTPTTAPPTATPGPTATATPGPSCTTFDSGTLALAIRDRTNTYSTIAVPNVGTITDVNVTIGQISHTYDADLDIYIRNPANVQRMLSTDNGGSGDNYTNTVFDDEAATAVTSGSAPFSGSYRPEQTLSAFDGGNAAGTWTLRVYDDARGDTGTLQSWSVTICTGGAAAPEASQPDAAPAAIAPSSLAAKAAGDRVLLSWQAGDLAAASFNIYVSNSSDGRKLLANLAARAGQSVYDYDAPAGGAGAWYTVEALAADGKVLQQATELIDAQ